MMKRTNNILSGVGILVVLLLSGTNSFLSAQDASEDLELIRVVRVKNHSLHVSPDGTKYVVPDAGGVVIRDVESGREICSAEVKTQDITPIAFSPDGKRIAVVNSGSYAVTICDTETGRKTMEIKVPPGKRPQRPPDETFPIPTIRFTPDGKNLLLGVSNEVKQPIMPCVDMIHVYHVDSGKLVREWDVLELHEDGGSVLPNDAFLLSPDGRYLLLNGAFTHRGSGPRFVLDIEDGSVVHKFGEGVVPEWFTSDSKTLLCGKIENYRVSDLIFFDMETKKEKKRLPYLGRPVAETPDGKHLFFFTSSGGTSQGLVGINIETGETVYELKRLPVYAYSLHAGTLLARRADQGKGLRESGIEYEFEFYELAPLETLIARARGKTEADSATQTETVVDAAPQWKQSRIITVAPMPEEFTERKDVCSSVALSPDGKLLVGIYHKDGIYDADGCYIVWDTASRKEITRLRKGGPYSFACFIPNAKELVLLQSPEGSLQTSHHALTYSGGPLRELSVFDTETWKVKRSIVYDGNATDHSPERRIFFNGGTCLCYKYETDAISGRVSWKAIDLTTGKNVISPDDTSSGVFVSPDGRTIGIFSYSYEPSSWKLTFYDSATKKKNREFKNPPFMDAQFLPDGKKLQATYHDSQGSKHVILDAESGEVLGAIGKQQFMHSPIVSPDGRYCYAINGRNIQIYEINTFKQVGELAVGVNDISSPFAWLGQVVLSHNGKTLAVKSHWGYQVMIFTQE